MPLIKKKKRREPELVLEFQRQVGPYPRAIILQDGMRVADVVYCGSSESIRAISNVFKLAGVEVTIDNNGERVRSKQ